ncbi:hypothetical protein [Phytopseudomonas daroniae]|uniref:hypothetical protein n=1 Tax=Phytopseudomonas daroniae TaxID=2487519 RepID=UPI001FC90CD8|nr:hypothetical protein [Pseudomonas daroniae]
MKHQPLLLVAIVLLGLNLRPVLAAVGPLLDRIQLDTGLGHVGASLLTSLPIVIMGLGVLAAGVLRQYTDDLRLSWLAMAVATLALMAMAARFKPGSGHFHTRTG